MASLKPLIMRSNRLLGASLVDQNLVSIDDLDKANERLLEIMSEGSSNNQVSLLSILVNEMQCLQEDALFEKCIENHGLGIIDVRNIELPEEISMTLNPSECWATWTVPFDYVEDTRYLATAYYLSPPVRKHWEEKMNGKAIWFATSLESIAGFLESVESAAANAAYASAN